MTDTKRTLFELAAADPEVRFSPHCWKTRLALAHKGLAAQRIPWRFSDKQEIAFSGQGLVPVLTDGDEPPPGGCRHRPDRAPVSRSSNPLV